MEAQAKISPVAFQPRVHFSRPLLVWKVTLHATRTSMKVLKPLLTVKLEDCQFKRVNYPFKSLK